MPQIPTSQGCPIQQLGLEEPPQGQQLHQEHEAARNLLESCCGQILFRQLEEGAYTQPIYKIRDIATADVYHDIEVFYIRTRSYSDLARVSTDAFEGAYL